MRHKNLTEKGGGIEQNFDEVRGAERCAVNAPAQINRVGGKLLVHCQMKNISLTGALLKLDTETTAPEIFDIEVAAIEFKIRCHRVWQSGSMVGLRFINQLIDLPQELLNWSTNSASENPMNNLSELDVENDGFDPAVHAHNTPRHISKLYSRPKGRAANLPSGVTFGKRKPGMDSGQSL